MMLYHGTTQAAARKILKEGIKPRAVLGVKGNWEHTVTSASDRVYLTKAYAAYFAFCAAKKNQHLAVLEVDVDKLDKARMYPDEDFLEQVSRNQPRLIPYGQYDMTGRTRYFRDNIEDYRHHWEDSLDGLGNCSYKGTIPKKAITRVVAFDLKKNPLLLQTVMDPSISLLAYKVVGDKYINITRWLFGEEMGAEEFYGGMVAQLMPGEMVERAAVLLKDRSAIKWLRKGE